MFGSSLLQVASRMTRLRLIHFAICSADLNNVMDSILLGERIFRYLLSLPAGNRKATRLSTLMVIALYRATYMLRFDLTVSYFMILSNK